MKKTLFLLLFLPFLSIAQQDKGDLVFIYDAPNEYNRVTQELYFNKGLEKYREYINRKFVFPYDIKVYFTDCKDENAWYSKGSITLCYNYIKSKYLAVRQNLISDKLAGYEKLEREAVLGIATLTLGHELGHGFADFHQMPYTGKEESAVDEFSLMTFLEYNDEPKDVRSFYGVVSWYVRGINEAKTMGFQRYSSAHGPSLVRYYDLLNLYYDSGVGKEYRSLLIEGVPAKPWQLPRSRVNYSSGEYQEKKRIWSRLLAPYLKASGSGNYLVESPSLYGKPGGAKTGLALNVSGWGMGARPQVNDESNESGRIAFEITVDDTGDIVNVRVKESTVSQSVVDVYKRAVARMKLVPKSENVPATSKGTITFNIKGR